MSRFFVAPENVGEKNIVIDNKEDLHHMIKVLRMSEGDELDISDSQEWEYRAKLIYLDTDSAEAEILDKQKFTAEPEVKVTLFQGIPKQGKMETIVQKTVELGVNRIVPVFMARTVVADKGKFGKKIERWQKVAAEAVKQCRRGIIPEVCDAVKSKDLPDMLKGFDLVLFPYENETGRTIKDSLRELKDKPATVAVIIGPEGGFSDKEADSLKACGADCVSLGKTILRTETAGMTALSMVMYELEL
jgi:16S rRNA (uracil1498-N3)-methyltransferase